MSDELTFEQSLERLEALVKELEQGGLDLDRSLEIYEQAIVLRDRCRRILDDSQRRVQALMETAEGLEKRDISI